MDPKEPTEEEIKEFMDSSARNGIYMDRVMATKLLKGVKASNTK